MRIAWPWMLRVVLPEREELVTEPMGVGWGLVEVVRERVKSFLPVDWMAMLAICWRELLRAVIVPLGPEAVKVMKGAPVADWCLEEERPRTILNDRWCQVGVGYISDCLLFRRSSGRCLQSPFDKMKSWKAAIVSAMS